MSIEVKNISKFYADTPVVDRVSTLIQTGEFFVLLGPSGSGKSTLLRMIAGLEEVHIGSVHLHGVDVTATSPKDRHLGFVFQNYVLFKHMTVAENIEFPLTLRKVAKTERQARRESLLAMVGLAGYGGRYPRQLSGGQQQRVALARALAHEPKILLLDEPFGALDAKIRVELRQALRNIQRTLGLTTVFVTHDQEEAFELADRLAVMNRGRILEVGEPRELYLRPRSQFVASFLGAANLLVGESLANSVKLGPLEVPLATDSAGGRLPRRVQVLFRPEDVALASIPSQQNLGQAVVDDKVFLGAYEHLRLRLPKLEGVRSVTPESPFGSSDLFIEARRSQFEASQRPLQIGQTTFVSLLRVHVLAPASLRFLVESGPSPEAQAASQLGTLLTEHLHAEATYFGGSGNANPDLPSFQQVSSEGDCEVIDEGYDVAIIGLKSTRTDPGLGDFSLIRHHLLLVSAPASLPRHLLICVAVGEPGKVDVRFAERFAWQLGAKATIMTVVPESEHEPVPTHVSLFLEAAVRALSNRGVTAESLIGHGPVVTAIRKVLATGLYDLLVVGVPLPAASPGPRERSLVEELFLDPPSCPLLMIRHT